MKDSSQSEKQQMRFKNLLVTVIFKYNLNIYINRVNNCVKGLF